MAQPPTTFRIEDLKARLKLEPKSRLFYPLAEELRKLDRLQDAEKVLRDGLAIHAGYISAWISLGRVLLEQQKHQQAVEILQKACSLDPGNVVAARLLADAYLGVGERVEAIKKYKLVRALLPADEGVEAIIERLQVDLAARPAPPPAAPSEAVPPAPTAEEVALEPPAPEPPAPSERVADTEPFRAEEPAVPLTPTFAGEGAVPAVDVDAAISGGSFTSAAEPFAEEIVPPRGEVVGEAEVAAEEQREFPLPQMMERPLGAPFPEPEVPQERPAELSELLSSAEDRFDQTMPLKPEAPPAPQDLLATPTMAELYARQGYPEAARDIYSKLLEKEPQNQAFREKLEELKPSQALPGESGKRKEAVTRLEGWLSKVRK